MKIYIDGKILRRKNAKISVLITDCFTATASLREFALTMGGVQAEEHIDRLSGSAKAILLSIPMSPRPDRPPWKPAEEQDSKRYIACRHPRRRPGWA